MQKALDYIYYVFDKCIVFLFNDMELKTNVTFGWIVVSVIIFGLLIQNILNLPRHMSSFDKFREHEYVSNVTDSHGNKHSYSVRRFRR